MPENQPSFSPYRTRSTTARWFLRHPGTRSVFAALTVAAIFLAAFFAGPPITAAVDDWLNPEPEVVVLPGETVLVSPADIISARDDLESALEDAEKVLEQFPASPERDGLAESIEAARDLLADPSSRIDAVSAATGSLADSSEAVRLQPTPSPTPKPAPAPEPEPEPDPAPVEPPVQEQPRQDPAPAPRQDPPPAPEPAPKPAGAPWSVSCSGDAVATVTVDGSSWTTTGDSGTFYSDYSMTWTKPNASAPGSCS